MSRRFHLKRIEDATGISGTGRIAEGVQFTSGECVLNWLTKHRSQAFYANIETLDAIHGHGGKTAVIWDDTTTCAGHALGPFVGHWGESKCQRCDAVLVEPDGVWYRLNDPSQSTNIDTPSCVAGEAS